MTASDFRKYQTLLESLVTEGYEDRVNAVASQIEKQSAIYSYTAKDLPAEILRIAKNNQVPDVSASGNAAKEFVKDVINALKGKIKLKKSSVSPENLNTRIKLLQNAIKMVNRSLENITDGVEPIDHLIDQHRRYGFESEYYGHGSQNLYYMYWANTAARLILAGKEYDTASYPKYLNPSAMKAAEDKGFYSKLISKTADSFIDDNPELAQRLGLEKGQF